MAVMHQAVAEGGRQDLVPKISPQSSNPLLELRTVEARSYRRVISWKKSIAAVRLIGR
jgi:hypothetical protein